MIGNTPTRDGRSSSIGVPRIFCSMSSESWPFGSRANPERSSGGGGAAGARSAWARAMGADAILILAPQPARTTNTRRREALVICATNERRPRSLTRIPHAVFAAGSADFAGPTRRGRRGNAQLRPARRSHYGARQEDLNHDEVEARDRVVCLVDRWSCPGRTYVGR